MTDADLDARFAPILAEIRASATTLRRSVERQFYWILTTHKQRMEIAHMLYLARRRLP